MDTATFTAFLTYALVMAITPGPNNILTLSCVGRHGLRGSSRLIWGVSGGFVVVMLLSGLFSLTLSRALPAVMPWLVWLGAGYILWLAWHIAVAGTPEEGGAVSPPRFAAGFLLQFINVKVWLCGLTARSSFVLPQTTETLPVVGYSLALAFIGAGCNLIWGLAGDLLRGAFLRWGRRLNVALGLSLAYCGLRMVV